MASAAGIPWVRPPLPGTVHVSSVDGRRLGASPQIHTKILSIEAATDDRKVIRLRLQDVRLEAGGEPSIIDLTLVGPWAEALGGHLKAGTQLWVKGATMVPTSSEDPQAHRWRLVLGEASKTGVLEILTKDALSHRGLPVRCTLQGVKVALEDGSANVMAGPPPPQYTPIANLVQGRSANFHGIVTGYSPPRRSKGTDWFCILFVRDNSCPPGLVYRIKFFNDDTHKLPKENTVGHILRVHRVMVDRGFDNQCTAYKQQTAWLVIPAVIPPDNSRDEIRVLASSTQGWSAIDRKIVRELAEFRDRLIWEAEPLDRELRLKRLSDINTTGMVDLLVRIYHHPSSVPAGRPSVHVWDGSVLESRLPPPILPQGLPHPGCRVLLPRYGHIVPVDASGVRPGYLDPAAPGRWVRLMDIQCVNLDPLRLIFTEATRYQILRYGHPKIAQVVNQYRVRRNTEWHQTSPVELHPETAVSDAAFFDDVKCCQPHEGPMPRPPPPMRGPGGDFLQEMQPAQMLAEYIAHGQPAPQLQQVIRGQLPQDSNLQVRQQPASVAPKWITKHGHPQMPISPIRQVMVRRQPVNRPFFRVTGRVIHVAPENIQNWVVPRCRHCQTPHVPDQPVPATACKTCVEAAAAGNLAWRKKSVEAWFSVVLTIMDGTGIMRVVLSGEHGAKFFANTIENPLGLLQSSRHVRRHKYVLEGLKEANHTLDLCLYAHPIVEARPMSYGAGEEERNRQDDGPLDPWEAPQLVVSPSQVDRVFFVVDTELLLSRPD